MQIEHSLYPFLERLARAAGEAILPHFRTNGAIDNKLDGGFDPVTAGDRAGEAAMRALINAEYPRHGILGEEYGPENTDADEVWVLDPIDGTRSFITGLPTWGTLIGLKQANRPALGMMVQPYVNEAYAGDGKSAWYSGPLGTRQLKTRACASLSDAVLFTTTPRIFKPVELAAYDRIEAQTRLARYGTDCYAYCMVAAGLADLVIESGLQAYDIVALVPIIEGAGGIVTSWTGGSPVDGGRILASGDPRLHELVLKELAAVPAA
ncbi:histidinol-phosphatase [Microvirga tunisiensis]|uniref:Histidinol-phosphatase n=2 Tax=Pannonibacter tanglangensis TaxID=2750084 RepID=A0A7X5F4Q8_9HYPH|nr:MULTISPECIES: histidinol-phosphatase [unclassified Pannonibacter]NBN65302.1 histidinol-phosphatase [Pannonibacter sp. XCT-34]NBN79721.1 histidinol-phosphatase [Pannonibacter sp. XCT-53]